MKKYFMFILLIAGFVAFTVSSSAAAEFTCKISLQQAPIYCTDGPYPTAKHFQRLVEARTGGAIEVKLYTASQLGNETESMEGLQLGTIQIALPAGGAVTKFVPETAAFTVPFLFNSNLTAWKFFDSEFLQNTMKPYRKKGFRFLGVTDDGGGFAGMTNSVRPVYTTQDVKGIKMRTVEHPGMLAFWRALNVAATPMAWEELYTALKTGVVDGQSNGASVVANYKLYEVQKYYCQLNHVFWPHTWFVSEKWFKSLPENYQRIVMKSFEEAKWVGRGTAVQAVLPSYDKLAEEKIVMTFPTEEQIDGFKKVGQPAYIKWLKKELDNKFVDSLLTEVDRIRESN